MNTYFSGTELVELGLGRISDRARGVDTEKNIILEINIILPTRQEARLSLPGNENNM